MTAEEMASAVWHHMWLHSIQSDMPVEPQAPPTVEEGTEWDMDADEVAGYNLWSADRDLVAERDSHIARAEALRHLMLLLGYAVPTREELGGFPTFEAWHAAPDR